MQCTRHTCAHGCAIAILKCNKQSWSAILQYDWNAIEDVCTDPVSVATDADESWWMDACASCQWAQWRAGGWSWGTGGWLLLMMILVMVVLYNSRFNRSGQWSTPLSWSPGEIVSAVKTGGKFRKLNIVETFGIVGGPDIQTIER